MSWFVIQSLLTILAAFAVGIVVGRLSHIRRRTEKRAPIPVATPAVAPVATPAVAPAAKPLATSTAEPAADDELERIEGIGPALANALRAAGLRTFAQLADSDDATKRAAIQDAGFSFAPSLPTWGPQAQLLADGDETAFRELTERLIAGRPEKAAVVPAATAQPSTAPTAGRPGQTAATQNTKRGRKTPKANSIAAQDTKADAIREAKATVDGSAAPGEGWRDLSAPDAKLTIGGGTRPETGRAAPLPNDDSRAGVTPSAADHRVTADGTRTTGTAPRANDDTETSTGSDLGDAMPASGRDTTAPAGGTTPTAPVDGTTPATPASGTTSTAKDGAVSRPDSATGAGHRTETRATRAEDHAAPGANAEAAPDAIRTEPASKAADGERTDASAAPGATGTQQGTGAESAR